MPGSEMTPSLHTLAAFILECSRCSHRIFIVVLLPAVFWIDGCATLEQKERHQQEARTRSNEEIPESLLRIGSFHSECFSKGLVKKARLCRWSLIEWGWARKAPALFVTRRHGGDAVEFEASALHHHGAGPASHSVRSERSPTGSECHPTWSPAHLQTSKRRQAIRDAPST